MLADVEILPPHMGDLAGALPGHKDHAKRATLDQPNIVQRTPDKR
jgi:hypothetical protein